MKTALMTRRDVLTAAAAAALALGAAPAAHAQQPGPATASAARARPNVLFIAVDDLKPLLGAFGDRTVKTPHIDRLARRGVVFSRAYCQQAVCAPSRNAVMTSVRPDSMGIYDLGTNFRTRLPNAVTLPQFFKSHGYHAEAMGKIFHVGHGNHDDPRSWSAPSWPAGNLGTIPPAELARPDAYASLAAPRAPFADAHLQGAGGAGGGQQRQQPGRKKNGPPFGAPDVADDALQDGKTAARAVERLGALKGAGRPFFLAVGFARPHLPFIAPKRYWDLYKRDQFRADGPERLPEGAPRYAGHGPGELASYAGVAQGRPVPEEQARELVHGYHASISYMDAQVGRVLDALEKNGLAENTVVVLWGDHGWHLGDHGQWAKHTNFEQATRAPLIVAAPGRPANGKTSSALVEFVDIYPTLADVAGLPAPAGIEGASLTPLLTDPARPWKTAAFHVWPRREKNKQIGLGRSMRTARYRLTEWAVDGEPGRTEYELYDYEKDPQETVNLAAKPGSEKLLEELKARLRAGWKDALPPGVAPAAPAAGKKEANRP